MKQPRMFRYMKTSIIVGLMLLGSSVFMAYSHQRKPDIQTKPPPQTTPKVTVYDFSQLVAEVKSTVLTITVLEREQKDQPSSSTAPSAKPPPNLQEEESVRPTPEQQEPSPALQTSGSGFLIHPKGYALTNDHVVKHAKRISVELEDQREYEARVIGRSPLLDLALLQLEVPKGTRFRYARLGRSGTLQVGEPVVAIGNAKGLGLTVTSGIVSAKGRTVGSDEYESYIQTDAAINLGNSGGPLFNRKGEVIGINTAILQGGRGIGFAIPIDIVRQILPQLHKTGKVERSQLGVKVQQVATDVAQLLGLSRPQGALVTDVAQGSAASKAGLKIGDVILSINGQTVRTHQCIPHLVAFQKPGTHLVLKTRRDRKDILLRAVLQAWRKAQHSIEPSAESSEPSTQKSKPKHVGITVASISPHMRQRLKRTPSQGAWIRGVNSGSLAASQGVKEGDILLKVNAIKVRSMAHARSLLATYNPKHPMLLLLQRQEELLYIVLH
ncbi:MAG: PDZ domain-containing protein [Deltaproteobacteria bacterium]|nr:MAG: PDZ domain-containing protein [Deltaproteobacteria bacterium]